MSDALAAQLAFLPDYLSRHLLLSVTALGIGIGISLPLAVVSTRVRALQAPLLGVASAIQTVPSLALLALMVPLLEDIGFVPAAIALVLYSMLPVLRNTITGLETVDPDLVTAGKGLGMTPSQLLVKVQLPLAMPVIIAGVRTATVWVVGITTLSTPVGATSLGNYIFSGLQTQNTTAVLVGCVAAAGLALTLDGLIRVMEGAARRRRRGLLAGTAVCTVALVLAGLSPILAGRPGSDARPEIVLGTKTFTEQYILARFLGDRLEDAGYRTRTVDSLGSTVVFDALTTRQVDCYVDYSGTLWANQMRRTDNPGRDAVLLGVRDWLETRHGIDFVVSLGFENAYALAVTRETAEVRTLATIDDLVPVAIGMSLGGDYEFFGRPEWRALEAQYGLAFEKLVTMDSTLMYAAVDSGQVDVITAFSTDGRIAAFDLVVLEDTREALPPYDALLMCTPEGLARAPRMANVLVPLEGAVTTEAMRTANRHVDVDGESVEAAARLLSARLATQARAGE